MHFKFGRGSFTHWLYITLPIGYALNWIKRDYLRDTKREVLYKGWGRNNNVAL